jgi:glyceraldehyde 3-phosphate dehydrogenase
MGRLALRAGWGSPDLDFLHVNEVKGGPEAAAHLLAFDSVHGRWKEDIRAETGALLIGSRRVPFRQDASHGNVAWAASGVDIVYECTGRFRTAKELQPYFDAGVRKVIVAAP